MKVNCNLCPRRCNVKRSEGKMGYCKALLPKIASYCIHKGEEPPIAGKNGSGALFFSHCTLSCVFCQNYPISQYGVGNFVTVERMSEIMLSLQEKKAENINLISADHYIPWVINAVRLAKKNGLKIPIVLNTSSFLTEETVRQLVGVVDIYLADFKYFDEITAKRMCGFSQYTLYAKKAIKIMYNQVGGLKIVSGTAKKGLIIRHLILPHYDSQAKRILQWIKINFGASVPVSIMRQYFPAYKAVKMHDIACKITDDEYYLVLKEADKQGLSGWIQNNDHNILADVS